MTRRRRRALQIAGGVVVVLLLFVLFTPGLFSFLSIWLFGLSPYCPEHKLQSAKWLFDAVGRRKTLSIVKLAPVAEVGLSRQGRLGLKGLNDSYFCTVCGLGCADDGGIVFSYDAGPLVILDLNDSQKKIELYDALIRLGKDNEARWHLFKAEMLHKMGAKPVYSARDTVTQLEYCDAALSELKIAFDLEPGLGSLAVDEGWINALSEWDYLFPAIGNRKEYKALFRRQRPANPGVERAPEP